MSRFLFFLNFSLLIFCGCHDRSQYKPSIYLPDSLFIKHAEFDFIDVLSVDKPFEIDQVAEKIDFIPLETHERSLFERANNLFVSDSLIIINSSSSVLFWDKNGKFLRRFQKLGRGPGEYTGIFGFSVDFDEEIMVIADDISVKIYALDGTFIRDLLLPKPPFELTPTITFLNSDHLLIENDRSLPKYENGFSPLWIFNIKSGESKPVFQNYPDSANNFDQVYNFMGELRPVSDGILYSAVESYNIYHINKDLNPALIYKPQFGKYHMPDGLLHDGYNYRDYRQLFIRISNINVTDKYLFVRYGIHTGIRGINYDQGYFVYDRFEKALIANQFESPGLTSSTYPALYFWPMFVDADQRLVSLHWPDEFDNTNILPEVKETDNPILSFITLDQ